ncbi:hypothetical protein, partial [Ralstonia pseudosolanacearum]|uniref:hypothetical protein n=1 Tax=Ralstonia pseudosolanacearum TaxID=1310165 RepID=UPI001FF928BE
RPRIASVCRPHRIACMLNASTSNPFTQNTYIVPAVLFLIMLLIMFGSAFGFCCGSENYILCL